jgi:hypothetical protein
LEIEVLQEDCRDGAAVQVLGPPKEPAHAEIGPRGRQSKGVVNEGHGQIWCGWQRLLFGKRTVHLSLACAIKSVSGKSNGADYKKLAQKQKDKVQFQSEADHCMDCCCVDGDS